MDSKMKRLRDQLDDLGYYQSFTPESASLIENLLSDLKTTTASLKKYMNLAQKAIEEGDNLKLGAEPYKCDNAKLIKECNDLHLAFMHHKEENENIQRDLNRRLEQLKFESLNWISEKQKLKNHIRDLELELVQRKDILSQPKAKTKATLKSGTAATIIGDRPIKKSKSFEINSAMALADQKITNLSKDIKKLKEHNFQLLEANESLQSQLSNRDTEIKRLNRLLEGGRLLHANHNVCSCTKQAQNGYNILQDELNKTVQEKNILENRLKESLAKQHEAMKRALHLAERNKHLEKEMQDIDHLALAVEAECNNTVKNNTEKVNCLKRRMQESIIQIQVLERESIHLKQDKEELNSQLDAVIAEKKHLQTVLETSLEEKKRLSDKINSFTIIEHDLNMEIDRLMRLSSEQKRKIGELEVFMMAQTAEHTRMVQDAKTLVQNNQKTAPGPSPTRQRNKTKKKVEVTKSTSESPSVLQQPAIQVPTNTARDLSEQSVKCCNCHCGTCVSCKHLKELLDKELEYRDQQSLRCIESLKSEKDYYMKEYHKVLEQVKNVSRPTSGDKRDNSADLVQKLAEKEQSLAQLEHENKILSKEKFNLISRLDSSRNIPSTSLEEPCLKATCKRTERERDILRADTERLEEEVQALKYKLQNTCAIQVGDQERLQSRLLEAEQQIQKLTQERRELVQNQGTRRAAINTLEEQCDTTREQLRVAQNELNQQRALCDQLKNLQEQTNRALSDTQSKLIHAETELADALESLKKCEFDRSIVNKEVNMLRNDVQIMKMQLKQMDEDKDELLMALDDKTEKMAKLEVEIKTKENAVASSEAVVNELKKKLGLAMDEGATREHEIRSSHTELATLKQEIERSKKLKDDAIQENRRLQNDLTAATSDCREARKELELCRRQVDDLKTQLQQYIAEVKRTEDLISSKEIERNELLDQFRSLSQEANILESNNHTLENEATQSRVQLSVALDHATDLERTLENKDSIIHSYEKQIADLTSQIASLEIQLRQCMNRCERAESELVSMRELSARLDGENGKFRRQLRERDEHRLQEQLRNERETEQWESSNVERIEKDLQVAKHETSELKLLNQDLQSEMQRLKTQVQDLRDKLGSCVCDRATNTRTNNSPTVRHSSDSDRENKARVQNFEKCEDRAPQTARCMCLNVHKLVLEKRPASRAQSVREKKEKRMSDSYPMTVQRDDAPKVGVKSCMSGSDDVKSYVANYVVVHNSHRREDC